MKPRKIFNKAVAEAKETLLRMDNWMNSATGLGTIRDKRQWGTVKLCTVEFEEAQAVWRSDVMACRVIEQIVRDSIRRGWGVQISNDDEGASGEADGVDGRDTEDTKQIEEQADKYLDALNVKEELFAGASYARAYGGSVVLIGANDGTSDPAMPLNEEGIESIEYLAAVERADVYVRSWYEDPSEPKFGKPKTFVVNTNTTSGISLVEAQTRMVSTDGRFAGAVEVHESRLLWFTHGVVSKRQLVENKGFGDSVLTRLNPVLRDYDMAWQGISALLADFGQAVFKMEGLAELMNTGRSQQVIERMQTMEIGRSVARGIFLDSSEDFERKSTSLTGYPEVLEKYLVRLAAAADMPVTILMGQSPAGMNATGEGDTRAWYDRVEGYQEGKLSNPLEYLYKLVFLAKNGPTGGKIPNNHAVVFVPLWQPTEKEVAETRALVAQTDASMIQNGVVSAEEVAKSRYGGETYSMETVLDMEAREAQEQAASQVLREELLTPPTPEDDEPPPEPEEDED